MSDAGRQRPNTCPQRNFPDSTPPGPSARYRNYVHLRWSPVREVYRAYREELGPRDRSALWSWLGFTGTFAGVRGITYSIRDGDGPFHNLRVGGAHLHHYMFGIGMVSAVGWIGIVGERKARQHPATAVTYGSGLALIVDEFALLLDLKDVYWTKQGRLSVDLGVGLVALGGTIVSAVPIIQRLIRDHRRRPAPTAGPSSVSPSSDRSSPAQGSVHSVERPDVGSVGSR
jgi:hypothetical protein